MEVRDLTRVLGGRPVVDGATFSAQRAEITCVLGPNGAGKTTTIECLEGLQRPDGGSVRVLDADPWHAGAAHRARVGVMLQDGGLPQSVTPQRLLAHLDRLYSGTTLLAELSEQLELSPFARTPVRRLSGGQRQRVALAAALLARPDVAFLDEPSAGLDPHAQREVHALLRRTADDGAALVVTTHSFTEAERLADRLVIMHRGTVVAEGSPAQVSAGSSLEQRYFELTDAAAA
ncbi:ABC-2 type transport system ATP-binding protein [Marihabitans asiaticum]|uniref:ABC-2 type transport system ATP-binding protein n=1 Tax=Marihabitans asiaticum TaxID=415218 RepID=A0A560WAV1_9MICO|nr:ABC-2 type transport system ATP-binding protein [Marihabitans asiaticum]